MNVRSGFSAHDVNPAFFADGLVIGDKAESMNLSLVIQVTNRHHDGRRINAAGERRAERDVAAQMQLDVAQEKLADAMRRLRVV
jgi:hypothetical protein